MDDSEDCNAEPGHCKADIDMLFSCSAHRDTATACDYYEVVYSEQTMMKRYCFNRTQFNNDLHDVVYSKHKLLKRYKFMKTVVTDSNFDDSEDSYNKNSDACMNKTDSDLDDSEDSYLRSSAVFSDEECVRIRFNRLNDDRMKLTEEELCVFNNLSARSASWHDKDGIDDSSNYNACFSDILPFSSDVPLCNDLLVHFSPPAGAACSSAVLDFV